MIRTGDEDEGHTTAGKQKLYVVPQSGAGVATSKGRDRLGRAVYGTAEIGGATKPIGKVRRRESSRRRAFVAFESVKDVTKEPGFRNRRCPNDGYKEREDDQQLHFEEENEAQPRNESADRRRERERTAVGKHASIVGFIGASSSVPEYSPSIC